MAVPCPPRRPITAPCFVLCFLLGFVAGLFPFAHRHLHLDLNLPLPPPPTDVREPSKNPPPPPAPTAVERKLLLVVTPTRARPLQAYHLRRLAHTLRLVPSPLLWLVVEAGAATRETAAVLRGCGVMYRHLSSPAPVAPQDPRRRGRRHDTPMDSRVRQRNAALDHIEHHRLHGIVYFAEEGIVYSLDLFHHIRHIRSFGTWPVAMLAAGKSKTILEGPVCNGSRVVGWHMNEKNKRLRRFHVDMSGFAFNSSMLWDAKKRAHQAWNYIRLLDTVKEGFLYQLHCSRGEFAAVASWAAVTEKAGLDPALDAAVKLVYTKYLSLLEQIIRKPGKQENVSRSSGNAGHRSNANKDSFLSPTKDPACAGSAHLKRKGEVLVGMLNWVGLVAKNP